MTRPLPELTAQNEFFWTSGADGLLRIQECRGCQALIHPPAPVCRYCRQPRTWACATCPARPRSSAFTVNHRFGFPDLPPPYVVAQVAIVEDPRVRLTTNIVDCEPDELALGQPVEVRVRAASPTSGCRCSSPRPTEAARRAARRRDRTRGLRQARPADAHRREVRGPLGDHRDRHVEDRPPADGPAAVADDRRLRGGGRRRRSDVRRHRRPVHVSRARHRGHGRGRGHRARGRARPAPDVDQRRDGHLRSRRLGDRGDDGRRHRDGPPRAVLPHAVGGDLPAS